MNSLNSILIEGNLTRDPVLSSTPKGTAVCTFSLASNRFYRQEEESKREVSFFDIETWAKLAEACGENLKKGRGVRVVGRLKQDRWVDSEGKSQYRVKIVAEHVEFRPDFRTPADGEESQTADAELTEHAGVEAAESVEAEVALPF